MRNRIMGFVFAGLLMGGVLAASVQAATLGSRFDPNDHADDGDLDVTSGTVTFGAKEADADQGGLDDSDAEDALSDASDGGSGKLGELWPALAGEAGRDLASVAARFTEAGGSRDGSV